MNYQLVLMACDRPDYFRQVVDHWAGVRGLDDWNPWVSLEPSRVQEHMLALAHAAGFPARLNLHRHGVLHHPWVIMEDVFAGGADFCVIAEDDVLVSDDILEYYEWAAKRFVDEHVLAVNSAIFYETVASTDLNRVVVHDQFTPMCWGTWASRWRSVLRDTWDHDYSSGTPQHPQSGWDWNINLRVIPQGVWQVVSPVASRSDHIGARGVHTTVVSFPGSRSATFARHRQPGEFHL